MEISATLYRIIQQHLGIVIILFLIKGKLISLTKHILKGKTN